MGRSGKATTNEIKHPYVVELSVARDGLGVELSKCSFISRETFTRNMDVELLLSEANSIIVGAFLI